MAVNLLDMMKGAMGNQLAGSASKLLGENTDSTQSAISAILPALLGGMVKQGATLDGATKLLGTINSPNINTNIMTSLGGLFSGGANSNTVSAVGTQLLGNLFGDKVGGLVSAISAVSGLKSASTTSLLSMVAPIVFGFMKNHAATNNINASGLMNLLAGQKEHLQGAVDSRIGGALGLGAAFNSAAGAAGNIAGAGMDVAGGAAAAGGGLLKKSLPWLLIGIGGVIAFWILRDSGTNEKTTEKSAAPAPTKVPTAAPSVAAPALTPTPLPSMAASAITQAAAPAALAMKSIQIPGGGKLDVTPGGFLENFYNLINDKNADLSKPLKLENVNFATNSARLTDDSIKEIAKVAAVMKAFPNVAIRVEGHTDSKGNAEANKKLSGERASSVKASLAGMGTDPSRVESIGFGAEKSVASNDTDEGRAKNRRVEVYLTKK